MTPAPASGNEAPLLFTPGGHWWLEPAGDGSWRPARDRAHTRPGTESDGLAWATPGVPVSWCAFTIAQVLAAAASTAPDARPRTDPATQAVARDLLRRAHRIPYLDLADNQYIYPFRTERERNRAGYILDDDARRLYDSAFCALIKAARRSRERQADAPSIIDFGAVAYLLPSHFGFCLGVQNAIERAYEALSENPGRRVFMLSELIHNPFVNADLARRGLRFLQTDKGKPLSDAATGRTHWDSLTPDDIVVLPAFGATDEDKSRLVSLGINPRTYDATCMLVEKVWKAARRDGAQGCTIIIHGKAEHEETRTTFSNSAKAAPSLILRDMAEARILGEIILEPDPAAKRTRFAAAFAGKHTPGFDPCRDLEHISVVNQTTLLRNETLAIIEHLHSCFVRRDGAEAAAGRMRRGRDTLCYATQVNQDALGLALDAGPDFAIVVGGKNSSNTWQLYRVCEARLGTRAYYIQSEDDILPDGTLRHFTYKPESKGYSEHRPFRPDDVGERSPRILITGGASCPDGLIQQVMMRLNAHFPEGELLSPAEALSRLGELLGPDVD